MEAECNLESVRGRLFGRIDLLIRAERICFLSCLCLGCRKKKCVAKEATRGTKSDSKARKKLKTRDQRWTEPWPRKLAVGCQCKKRFQHTVRYECCILMYGKMQLSAHRKYRIYISCIQTCTVLCKENKTSTGRNTMPRYRVCSHLFLPPLSNV